jgi:hypothetical protein
MADQKQLENVEHFSSLLRMITVDARCTLEVKARTVIAKAAFYRKKTLFTSKPDFNIRKKPV